MTQDPSDLGPEQQPRWLDDTEQAAWRGFLRAHLLVQDRLRRQLQRDTDLSIADYEVLVNLSEAPDGSLRSFQLGAAMQWEASRLSHQLRRMEQRGLVQRRSCGGDRRGVDVALTERGREAIRQAAPLHVAEVREVFIDALDRAQLESLISVASTVEKRHADLPTVGCPDGPEDLPCPT